MAADVETPTVYPRVGGYPVSSTDESNAGTGGTDFSYTHSRPRPNMIRRETDQILSYYQSEHVGRSDSSSGPYDHVYDQPQPQRPKLNHHDSLVSSNSSEYSTESVGNHEAQVPAQNSKPQPTTHSQHTRRPSVPSQESVDRRRLAIVEVEPALPPSISRRGSEKAKGLSSQPGVPVSSSPLLSRRGLHVNGLALVAPPDASPSTYTDLTPPPSAPLFASERTAHYQASFGGHHHSHSASETVGAAKRPNHKRSRDVGIIGMGSPQTVLDSSGNDAAGNALYHSYRADANGLQVPIFQTPTKSRSPSPSAHTPNLSDSATASFNESLQATPGNLLDISDRNQARTPNIGEEKDIKQPVVGPVVVDLESDHVIRRSDTAASSDLSSPASQYTACSSSPIPAHLTYQPGINATAGPLPMPPGLTSNMNKQTTNGPPPRPPRTLRTPLPEPASLSSAPMKRDLEALKESLQLPKSVSAIIASRSSSRLSNSRNESPSSRSETREGSDIDTAPLEGVAETKRTRTVHRREGAFPPSDTSPLTSHTSPPTSSPVDLTDYPKAESRPLPEVPISRGNTPTKMLQTTEPEVIDEDARDDQPSLSRRELHRENSWVSLKANGDRASLPNGKPQRSPDRHSISGIPTLSSPPKTNTSWGVPMEDMRTPSSGSSSSSGNPFKTTLNNLRRFSALPRTPSQLSIRSRLTSPERPSRTPSPPFASTPKIAVRRRIVNPWPDAMIYNDVLALRDTRERSELYAKKIVELTMYESGLRGWIEAMHAKRVGGPRTTRSSGRSGMKSSLMPPKPGEAVHVPRHVSGGSVGSEMTFPVRPDAYKATDLTMRPDDDLSSTKIPPSYLPYPSLAANPSRGPYTTTRTYQVPLSSGISRSSTGFFASIGRKASLKKDRGLALTPPSPARVLSKRLPTTNTAPPRALQINHAPIIPGGPRAAPGRVARSKTISIAPAPVEYIHEKQPEPLTRSETRRQSLGGRRNSLFHRSTITASVQPPLPPSNPEFERQVDKLADLLPHADRKLLAAYLRRAGQDVLAIGQYLEDEKNEALHYD